MRKEETSHQMREEAMPNTGALFGLLSSILVLCLNNNYNDIVCLIKVLTPQSLSIWLMNDSHPKTVNPLIIFLAKQDVTLASD